MTELFSWVYRLLRSKLLGVVVILAMAALALLGTLIMQAPASTVSNPASYAQWLDNVRPRYGGWTPILSFLGLFRIWSSPLFLAVTVLLTASIIACTTHRLPQLIQRAQRPRTHVTEKFFEHAQYRAEMVLPMSVSAALEHVSSTLAGLGYRILPDQRDSDHSLYADRFRYGPFGTVIAHTSFVIILAAFAISGFGGFERNLDVAVGETVEVGAETGLAVTATSFNDNYDEQGRPLDYVSHLIVTRDGTTVGEADVRVNSPLVVDHIAFHQASFGIAAAITVSDDQGKKLFSGSVPLRWHSDDGNYAIGKVTPAGTNIEVMVVTAASGQTGGGIEAGNAIFELHDQATSTKLATVPAQPGQEVEAEGLKLVFEREQRYTGIIARHDPGALWMWIGSCLLILGSIMTFAMRHRRIWVRVSPAGDETLVRLASAEKLDTTFERQFRSLVAQIDESAPGGSTPTDQPEEVVHA